MNELLHLIRSTPAFTEGVGAIAAILTTVSFVPQAFHAWRKGGNGLSWMMLALFGAGVGLWFLYGLLRESNPIMLANGFTGLQILFIAAIKILRPGRSGNATLSNDK